MRKPFLDNLRYSIVLLVIIFHIFYLFNSVGVITSVSISGIPAADVVEYLLYPWFMVAMFVISGICALYSLDAGYAANEGYTQKQTHRQFLKSKARQVSTVVVLPPLTALVKRIPVLRTLLLGE